MVLGPDPRAAKAAHQDRLTPAAADRPRSPGPLGGAWLWHPPGEVGDGERLGQVLERPVAQRGEVGSVRRVVHEHRDELGLPAVAVRCDRRQRPPAPASPPVALFWWSGTALSSRPCASALAEIRIHRDVSLAVMTRISRILGWPRWKTAVLCAGIQVTYGYERVYGWRRMVSMKMPERRNALGGPVHVYS